MSVIDKERLVAGLKRQPLTTEEWLKELGYDDEVIAKLVEQDKTRKHEKI